MSGLEPVNAMGMTAPGQPGDGAQGARGPKATTRRAFQWCKQQTTHADGAH